MSSKNAIKIGEKSAEALVVTGHDYKVPDTSIPGFHVRVSPGGAKAYKLSYRNRRGEQRTILIGRVGLMKAEQARRIAIMRLAEVKSGSDPSAERQRQLSATTVSALYDSYLQKHAIPNKRPRSVEGDRILWRLHLKPHFGAMAVADVRRDDVEAFLRSRQDRMGAANRAIALLSTMMNLAIRWEHRSDNPCRFVRRYEERPKERTLNPKEMNRLRNALEMDHDTIGAQAIRFLSLTGARRGEVLQATWNQFKIEGEVVFWVIQHDKLKALGKGQRELVRPLSKGAARLIRDRHTAREVSSDLVFPSMLSADLGRYDLNAIWRRVRLMAKLPDVRIHDLRHSFASAAFNSGLSLDMIGKVLGHADVRTTQRYAHANRASLMEVAEAVSSFYDS